MSYNPFMGELPGNETNSLKDDELHLDSELFGLQKDYTYSVQRVISTFDDLNPGEIRLRHDGVPTHTFFKYGPSHPANILTSAGDVLSQLGVDLKKLEYLSYKVEKRPGDGPIYIDLGWTANPEVSEIDGIRVVLDGSDESLRFAAVHFVLKKRGIEISIGSNIIDWDSDPKIARQASEALGEKRGEHFVNALRFPFRRVFVAEELAALKPPAISVSK